jgi:energy-coupling factor transporter transmembrane protein EcfT
MALNVTFGQYCPGDGPLHRLDPRSKIVLALCCMVAACLVSTPAQLALATALALSLVAASGVPVGKVLSSMRPLLAFLLVTSLFNLFWVNTGDTLLAAGPVLVTTGGVWAATLYTLRLALVVAYGVLLTLTTPPARLTDALDALLSPLAGLGLPTHEWSMVLSLALRFVPTLADDAQAVMDAQRSRGSSLADGSVLERGRAFASVLVPLFATSIRHAEGLSRALDARCYEGGATRTHWHEQGLGRPDAMAALLTTLYLVALLALVPAI